MNICLVSQEYPPETPWGGIGTQTRNKAHGLARLGHTVHVLTRDWNEGPVVVAEIVPGVIVHRMRLPEKDFHTYGRAGYAMGYAWSVFRELTQLMSETTFDIVDFPEFGGEGMAYLLDRTCWNWVPVVAHLHGSLAMFNEFTGWPEKSSRFYRYGTFVEDFTIREADWLMASSASHADLVCRHYGIRRESIDVVHCGVDADRFRPAAEGNSLPAQPTVLFVGNLVENKGVHTVVEAVIQLRRKHPSIVLKVIGHVPSHTDLMKHLNSRLTTEGALDNVEFVGFVESSLLPNYYQRSHVFCSPADFEGGTANVYLEAMACGCPVVASTAGGGPEAVTEGETGLLVPPNDVAATTAALDRILSDSPLRNRMGRAARQRIEEYFSIEKYVLRVQAAYEKTIAISQQKPERHLHERE